MIKSFLLAAALALSPAANAQEAAEEAPPEPATAPATTEVVLETTLGDVTVSVESERAPITAGNFLKYVDEGRFDGIVFLPSDAARLGRTAQRTGAGWCAI